MPTDSLIRLVSNAIGGLAFASDGVAPYGSPNNPRGILQEWLTALAEKSEADLMLVLDALHQGEERLKLTFANAIDLRWYAFRMKEKLRDMGSSPFTVEQIRNFLATRPALGAWGKMR